MNWLPGFFAPAAAWLFLLLLPLIAFYFLKLKRPRVIIPSLVLWRQVLNDQRVNAPFQRFRRNLLLLVQILLLVVLVLAAMQPFLPGDRDRAQRLPVLIDTSASMGAVDRPGGITRLDAAKERIGAMIDNLLPDQQMCLISVNATARQETVFTGDTQLLREALGKLVVHDVAGNLEDGLRMAEALGRGDSFDTLVLVSDGNFPEQAFLDLQFGIDFRKLAPGGANLGITACSARRAGNASWDLFVELRNAADAPSTATLSIKAGSEAGSEVLASRIITVRPEAPQRLVFRIDGRDATLLSLQLTPEGFDALDSDNVAYMRLQQNRPLNVFAPETFPTARRALGTLPDVVVHPSAADANAADGAQPGSFDLLVSNRGQDAEIPAVLSCIFGPVPAELADLVTVLDQPGEIVDWNRDSPLFEHVNLREIILMDTAVAAGGADSTAFGGRDYRVLVEGRSGPLMVEKESPAGRSIRAFFDPDRSTFPFRVAFPVFITNLVNEALAATGLAETRAQPTGVLESVALQPGSRTTIVAPDGSRLSADADAGGRLSGVVARQAGSYRIDTGTGEIVTGASLLSPLESSLTSVDTIAFNELSVTASADNEAAATDKPLWRHLAIAALALLVVEWWLFHKRPFAVKPRSQPRSPSVTGPKKVTGPKRA